MLDILNLTLNHTLSYPMVFLSWAVVWAFATKRINLLAAAALMLPIGGFILCIELAIMVAAILMICLAVSELEDLAKENDFSFEEVLVKAD